MMLLERVRTRLSVDGREATLASVAQALRHEGVVVGDLAALELVQALRDDLVGAGPLQALLDDPDVTDVIVNGPHEVCVDRGHGLELTPVLLLPSMLAFAMALDFMRFSLRSRSGAHS